MKVVEKITVDPRKCRNSCQEKNLDLEIQPKYLTSEKEEHLPWLQNKIREYMCHIVFHIACHRHNYTLYTLYPIHPIPRIAPNMGIDLNFFRNWTCIDKL